MSLHDRYVRLTPWELTFQSSDDAARFVESVDEEAAGRGADPEVPAAFLTMGAVAELVRRLEGEDAEQSALLRFGGLAFHSYHFAREGCPLYLLSVQAARYLVEGAPHGSPEPPSPSGYLQLPQHLFWAMEEAGAETPESIDGLFWTTTSNGDLHVMLATGVRPDRPGIGVVPLPPAPLADATAWLDLDARGGGLDFQAALPGGELDRLYGVSTSGEILKLVARLFAYIDAVPGVLESNDPPAGSEEEPAGPSPSSLPFVRVTLRA